jgi:hypothetical protein
MQLRRPPIRRAFLAPDGRGFAALTTSGTAHVWTDPDAAPRSFDVGAKGLPNLIYDRTGSRLVATSADRGVQVLRDGAVTPVHVPGDPKEHAMMRLSGDDRWLVALRIGSAAIVLHDLTTGATRQLDLGRSLRADGYFDLQIAHDGARIAVTEGEQLFLVDVASGAVRKVDAGANIWAVQFEPGGDLLFGAVGDFVQAWDLERLTVTPLWQTRGFARLVHLTPDRELVTREEGEIHRFAFGTVPREPEALHAWLRERAARLGP